MSYPFSGYDIGVLVMTSWVPKPMGHISQAGNYNFPVYYYPVDSTNTTNIHGGDKAILPDLITAAKHLEEMVLTLLKINILKYLQLLQSLFENEQNIRKKKLYIYTPFLLNVLPQ